jgi:hypothetical protein
LNKKGPDWRGNRFVERRTRQRDALPIGPALPGCARRRFHLRDGARPPFAFMHLLSSKAAGPAFCKATLASKARRGNPSTWFQCKFNVRRGRDDA